MSAKEIKIPEYATEENRPSLKDILVLAIHATIEEEKFNTTRDIEEIKNENENFYIRVISNYLLIANNYYDKQTARRWLLINVINSNTQDILPGLDREDAISKFQARFGRALIRLQAGDRLSIPLRTLKEEVVYVYQILTDDCEVDHVHVKYVLVRKLGHNTVEKRSPDKVWPDALLTDVEAKRFISRPRAPFIRLAQENYYGLHNRILYLRITKPLTVLTSSMLQNYFEAVADVSAGSSLEVLYDYLLQDLKNII